LGGGLECWGRGGVRGGRGVMGGGEERGGKGNFPCVEVVGVDLGWVGVGGGGGVLGD